MKTHTTNYTDTFIAIAEDSPATKGEMPPQKGEEKTIANMQFEMVYEHPYKYTSDDVIFQCYAMKNHISKSEMKSAREEFFSKGQPCLRSSPLTKRYGWGVHNDDKGKVAIYGAETKEYKNFAEGKDMKVVKAMRTKKA